MGIFPHELRGIIHHEAVGEVIEAVHNVFFALVFETFPKFLVAGRVAMAFHKNSKISGGVLFANTSTVVPATFFAAYE